MDEGKTVDVVFLDFSKGFDTVPQHPSGKAVQLWDEWVHGVLSEELAEGQSSKGCSE